MIADLGETPDAKLTILQTSSRHEHLLDIGRFRSIRYNRVGCPEDGKNVTARFSQIATPQSLHSVKNMEYLQYQIV
jgi:hypothetical protein